MQESTNSKLLEELTLLVENNNKIDPEYYNKFNVKKGLRNSVKWILQKYLFPISIYKNPFLTAFGQIPEK